MLREVREAGLTTFHGCGDDIATWRPAPGPRSARTGCSTCCPTPGKFPGECRPAGNWTTCRGSSRSRCPAARAAAASLISIALGWWPWGAGDQTGAKGTVLFVERNWDGPGTSPNPRTSPRGRGDDGLSRRHRRRHGLVAAGGAASLWLRPGRADHRRLPRGHAFTATMATASVACTPG